MTRPRVLALTCALLLLGATPSAALARPLPERPEANGPAHQPRAVLIARSFDTAFNADMRTGEFSSLVSMFSPNATLTMYSGLRGNPSRDQIDQAHGRAALTRVFKTFYAAFSGYQWSQVLMLRETATQVVSVEQIRTPRASALSRMETVFLIRAGKIQRLDWTITFSRTI